MRNYTDITLEGTERRRNYLVLEPNYHTTKFFTQNALAIEMGKTQVLMNKPVYLSLSISHVSKTVMHIFWYDYVKPKCIENSKLCYMDTDSFIVHVKPEDVYNDIAEDADHYLKEKIKK